GVAVLRQAGPASAGPPQPRPLVSWAPGMPPVRPLLLGAVTLVSALGTSAQHPAELVAERMAASPAYRVAAQQPDREYDRSVRSGVAVLRQAGPASAGPPQPRPLVSWAPGMPPVRPLLLGAVTLVSALGTSAQHPAELVAERMAASPAYRVAAQQLDREYDRFV